MSDTDKASSRKWDGILSAWARQRRADFIDCLPGEVEALRSAMILAAQATGAQYRMRQARAGEGNRPKLPGTVRVRISFLVQDPDA